MRSDSKRVLVSNSYVNNELDINKYDMMDYGLLNQRTHDLPKGIINNYWMRLRMIS